MLAIIPYEVRTLFQRSPWGNIAIIAVSVICFLLLIGGALPEAAIEGMILDGWAPLGFVGYHLLHAGWLHLIGNMLFLWVFGNAICGVMNSFAYASLYAALGVAAGLVHVLCDGNPAVGASGALCGVMGVYLAVYPLNRVNCLWWFMIRGGTFGVPGWLLIVFWFALDLWGASDTQTNVAHWAHVGGTVTGFGAGLLLLRFNVIDLFDYDHPTVLGLLEGQRSK